MRRARPAARAARLATAAVLVALALPGPVGAQTAAAEATVVALSVGDGSLNELVLPFGVTWRLGDVRFDANAAFASASYTQGGVTSSLSGLTDITVRTMIPMMDGRGRIIVAGNVPTGAEALDVDQLPVAGVITTDLLTLPVRSFGSGAGVTTGLAMAQPVGDWVAGGIVVYRVGSAYEPVIAPTGADAAEFRPGSEFRVRLGLERPAVSGVTVRMSGSWSRFGPDHSDDEAVFDRGDRVLGEVTAEFPFLQGAANVYAWDLYRSGSQLMIGATPQPTPASNLFGLGAAVSYPLNPDLTLGPKVEMMLQSGEPGYGGGSGWITRLGSTASYRYGPVVIRPAALLQFGGLQGEGVFGLVLRGGVLWQR